MPVPLLLDAALPTINQARELFAEHAMAVLGGWALLNLLVSGYFVARTDARTMLHHFHLMNVGWNVVNALLAVVGLLRANPNGVANLTLADSLTAQFNFEKLLVLNLGLDVAYLCVGSWLQARAATDFRPERLLGFGRSLWLQGGFLLVFDSALYLLYHPFAAQLLQLID